MNVRDILFNTATGLSLVGLLSVGCSGVLEPAVPGDNPGTPDAGGGPPPDASGDATPQQLFASTVAGPLNQQCLACHGPNGANTTFLGASADAHYDVLMEGYPNDYIASTVADSKLYTFYSDSNHYTAASLSAEQVQAMADWIQAEYDYHNSDNTGDEPANNPNPGDLCQDLTPQQCALVEFATCFNYQKWSDLSVYQVANNQSNQGTCQGCHNNGTGGFYADGDSLQTYRKWKESPYVTKLVTPVFDGNNEFSGLVASDAIAAKGNGGGHPSFTLDATYKNAIDTFVADTLSAYQIGGCIDDPGQ